MRKIKHKFKPSATRSAPVVWIPDVTTYYLLQQERYEKYCHQTRLERVKRVFPGLFGRNES